MQQEGSTGALAANYSHQKFSPSFGEHPSGPSTSSTVTSAIGLFLQLPALSQGCCWHPSLPICQSQASVHLRVMLPDSPLGPSESFLLLDDSSHTHREHGVILSPLSILLSPLPFLTYSHFQHCHFFWPCWLYEVEAVLGTETCAESYSVAETNLTSRDSAIHWWGAELLSSLL